MPGAANGNASAIFDEWAPSGLALLSDMAFEWLAKMFNLIEEGKAWPKSMMHARAAYMEKDPEDNLNPVAFRILQIMPVLYRKWATARLRALEPSNPAKQSRLASLGANAYKPQLSLLSRTVLSLKWSCIFM